MLIKLLDGGVEKIDTDEESYPGCPTCDYGSQYINKFEVTLTRHKVVADVSQMYEYRFSSGDLMNFMLPNIEKFSKMTELEFIGTLETFLRQTHDYGGFEIDRLRNFKVDFEVVKLPNTKS